MCITIELRKVLRWIAVFLCVLIPVTVYLSVSQREVPAVETGAWGLRFFAEGQAPAADGDREELSAYNARYVGNDGEKVLYLTFDCGYENGNTEKILDVLKEHNAPGAFFVVGHYLNTAPELVRRMAEEGHTVANHTWSHPDMSAISDEGTFRKELQQVEDAYKTLTGQELARYYRPPQGVYSTENLSMAQELGYGTVFWSLAHVDWKTDDQPDPQAALELLRKRTHNGAVVLLHNTSSVNAAILEELLTGWQRQGYTFGTLDQLFAD